MLQKLTKACKIISKCSVMATIFVVILCVTVACDTGSNNVGANRSSQNVTPDIAITTATASIQPSATNATTMPIELEASKTISFGLLSFELYNYHIISEKVDKAGGEYVCAPDELDWVETPENMRFTINRTGDIPLDSASVAEQFLAMKLPDYTALKVYRGIIDDSGITDSLEVAVDKSHAVYYVRCGGENYEIDLDYHFIWLDLFEISQTPELEVWREDIVCADGNVVNVIERFYNGGVSAQFSILQQKPAESFLLNVECVGYGAYTAILSDISSGITIQEFSGIPPISEVRETVSLCDANRDGYVDIVFLTEITGANYWYDIYVYNPETSCFDRVFCDEQLGRITVFPSYIESGFRDVENNAYVYRKFIWSDNTLVFQSEEIVYTDES